MAKRSPSRRKVPSQPGARAESSSDRGSFHGGTWAWFALGSVLLLAAVLSFREISELDLGFHLRAGQWILENRQWPRMDPFTYTVADHPYIDLHWLYQIALFGLYQLGGALALVSTHTLLVLAAFALSAVVAWQRCRSPFILAVLFLASVLAAELRFMVRPEVVTWLLLALTVLILERYTAGRPAPLWLLPIVHLLWVNVQGLFVLGWIVLGCFLVGRLIEQRRLDRVLATWTGASVLVTFINPYLHRGVLFPLVLMTRLSQENPFGQTISEFTSPWRLNLSPTYPFYPRLSLWCYHALAIATILVLLLTWRRRRPRDFLLTLAFLGLSIQAIRNIPLFILVCLPVLAAGVADLLPARREPRPKRSRRPSRRRRAASERFLVWLRAVRWARVSAVLVILVAIGLALRAISNAYYIADRRTERFGYAIGSATLPVEAVAFMKEQGISGRLFNHLNYGGYLMWQLSEPVFIDGRLEVMGEAFYQEYLAAGREKELLSLLDRYDAQVVIFPYLVANSWLQQLRAAPQWRLVYDDAQSVLYVRADTYPDLPEVALPVGTPAGLPIPVPSERRAEILHAPRVVGLSAWLEGFWRRQDFPRESLNLGIFFYYLDQLDAAEAFLLDALRAGQGRYFEIYNNLGAVYFKGQRYEEAAFCYQVVLQDQPGNPLARERLQEIEQRR